MSVTTAAKRSIADFIATVKQAADETDKGTSHPVAKADTGNQPAAEGARSAENSADTVEAVGKPAIDQAANATDQVGTDSAAADHVQIGTRKAPTGEDPSVETSSVNSTLQDPGTSHPASTDNPELGSKYASMATADLTKLAASLANQLLASPELTSALQSKAAADQSPAQSQQFDTSEAAQAGWDLAGLVAGDFDKQALDAAMMARMEDIIKTAAHDADNVIEYLDAYASQKQAMAMDPAMGGMDPAMGGMDPAMGGMDPAMGGMDPAMGEEPSIEQIIQMLLASGVSPEELLAALTAAGGAGGEMPADGGEMPAAGAMSPGGLEVEASARQPVPAAPAAPAAPEELKQAMANYFQELVARNRKA